MVRHALVLDQKPCQIRLTSGRFIDILEGVNNQQNAQYTLHSTPGCTQSNNTAKPYGGSVISTDCDYNVNGNQGCVFRDNSTASYVHLIMICGTRINPLMQVLQVRSSFRSEWRGCFCDSLGCKWCTNLVLAGQFPIGIHLSCLFADVLQSARKHSC